MRMLNAVSFPLTTKRLFGGVDVWGSGTFILLFSLIVNQLSAQVAIRDIPDQTIGLGGDFQSINLSAYNLGDDVNWEASFPVFELSNSTPDWNVRATDYQFEMNVTAVVKSRGEMATGDQHILAVFDADGKVRGVAQAIEIIGNWVYFMTVYGNQSGTELQFVFFDQNYQETLKGQRFDFDPNAIVGQPDEPTEVTAQVVGLTITAEQILEIDLTDRDFVGTEKVVLTATSVDNPADSKRDTISLTVISDYEPALRPIEDQVVAFGEPFKLITLSDYTELDDSDNVEYSATTGTDLTVLIDQTTTIATITYPQGWSGSEVVTFTVTDETAQQFSASTDVSFTVRPEEIAPMVSGLVDQVIGVGGIPESIDLNDYLASNNEEGIVWSYDIYDENGSGAPTWELNPQAFEFSMTMTCAVNSYGKLTSGLMHTLAAFSQSDSTLVGQANAIEVSGKFYYFLTVYSNTNNSGLYFQFFDANYEKVVDVVEKETFVSNAILGDPLEPVVLNAGYIAPSIADGIVSFQMLDSEWTGSEQFVFIATDTTTSGQLAGSDTLKIEVIDIQSPTLSDISAQEIFEGELFGPIDLVEYLGGVAVEDVTFSIAGADTLQPVLSNNRVNVTVPDSDYFGVSELIVTATHNDFANLFATKKITYTVVNVNDAPFIEGEDPDTIVKVGNLYRFEINGKDIDNANLQLSVTGNPSWLQFVENNGFGLLFGTPGLEDEGTSAIHLELTDGQETVTIDYELEVTNSYAYLTDAPKQTTNEAVNFEAFDLTTITEKTDDYTVSYTVSGGDKLSAEISGTDLLVTVPDEDWYGSEVFTVKMNGRFLDEPEEYLGEKLVVFEVLNVNDTPSDLLISSVAVSENSRTETLIGTFEAVDADPEDTHSFELVTGTDLFSIKDDKLYTKVVLNFEEQDSHSVEVKVTDEEGAFSTHTIIVNVQDSNDTPTDIQLDPANVLENQPYGTLIGYLTSEDEDAQDIYNYQLVVGEGSDHNASVLISEDEVLLKEAIDFEDLERLSIRVRVTDGGGNRFDQILKIEILDTFDSDILLSTNQISENMSIGDTVAQLSIENKVGDFTYQLRLGENDNKYFEIKGANLILKQKVDYESQNQLLVKIRATDENNINVENELIFSLLDANDAPFGVTIDQSSTDENQSVGTVIGVLQALDQDAADSHTFSLLTGQEFFLIEEDKLKVNQVLNYEQTDSYEIEVQVTDSEGEQFVEILEISVVDKNDAPTDISLSSLEIAENAPVGEVIGVFQAMDEDISNTHTFELVSGDGDSQNREFVISGNRLILQGALDYETSTSLSIRVKVTDQGSLSFTKPIQISVMDILDSDILLSSYSFSEDLQKEDTIANFSIDGKSGDYDYEFKSGTNDNAKFRIRGNYLTLNDRVDYEGLSEFLIDVRATDITGSVVQSIRLSAEDANESPTNILISNNEINENIVGGGIIGELSVIDPDLVESFDLSVKEGSVNADMFEVDSQGYLRTVEALNYEAEDEYEVTISALDKGGLSVERTFEIKVIDQNDIPVVNQQISDMEVISNAVIEVLINEDWIIDEDAIDSLIYSVLRVDGVAVPWLTVTENKYLSFTKSQLGGSTVSYQLIAEDQSGSKVKSFFDVEYLLPLASNSNLEWNIYPNPASDLIRWSIGQIPDQIKITDLKGKVVRTAENLKTSEYHLQGLESGVYLLELRYEGESFQTKLVIR